MKKDTSVIRDILYREVEEKLNKPVYQNNLKACIGRYMNKRSKELHDTMPCDRIFFGKEEVDDLFKSMDMTPSAIDDIVLQTYYGDMEAFNPIAAKDPTTLLILCIVRYFYNKKMSKETELAVIYLAFSGKFYPSVHYNSFPKCTPAEYRHVMEYVVNTKLTEKFDLKREKSIFKSVRSICITLLNTYGTRLKDFDDEDCVYIIQQLHTRLKSFMTNIASLYYEAYNNNEAITYDSDNLDEDNFRMVDNNSLKIDRIAEKAVNRITTTTTDYKICSYLADSNISSQELMGIIDAITDDNSNLKLIKELCTIIVSEFMKENPKLELTNIKFISFSLAAKPNTKNPLILRQKEIIEYWLNEESPAYRRRKSRIATRNSYHRALLGYFVFLIHACAKTG